MCVCGGESGVNQQFPHGICGAVGLSGGEGGSEGGSEGGCKAVDEGKGGVRVSKDFRMAAAVRLT